MPVPITKYPNCVMCFEVTSDVWVDRVWVAGFWIDSGKMKKFIVTTVVSKNMQIHLKTLDTY